MAFSVILTKPVFKFILIHMRENDETVNDMLTHSKERSVTQKKHTCPHPGTRIYWPCWVSTQNTRKCPVDVFQHFFFFHTGPKYGIREMLSIYIYIWRYSLPCLYSFGFPAINSRYSSHTSHWLAVDTCFDVSSTCGPKEFKPCREFDGQESNIRQTWKLQIEFSIGHTKSLGTANYSFAVEEICFTINSTM